MDPNTKQTPADPAPVMDVGSDGLLGVRPSRQKISAALRKAGHSRSESRTTRIRGWRNRTRGYYIDERYDGSVRVHYIDRDIGSAERKAEMLQKYATALEPLGGKLTGDEILFA